MDENVAGAITSICINLASGKGVLELDFYNLRKLGLRDADINDAIGDIRKGEVYKEYLQFCSNAARADDIGNALKAREIFVGRPCEETLTSFVELCKSENMKEFLRKDPDYLRRFDLELFRRWNEQNCLRGRPLPWSHKDSQMGQLIWCALHGGAQKKGRRLSLLERFMQVCSSY